MIQIGNPLAPLYRFGFAPRGTGAGPVSTDFRHEFHLLSGMPNHMIRFGFMPVGTAGAAPGALALPVEPTPFGAFGNFGLAFRI